jgi:hypothetical protein
VDLLADADKRQDAPGFNEALADFLRKLAELKKAGVLR